MTLEPLLEDPAIILVTELGKIFANLSETIKKKMVRKEIVPLNAEAIKEEFLELNKQKCFSRRTSQFDATLYFVLKTFGPLERATLVNLLDSRRTSIYDALTRLYEANLIEKYSVHKMDKRGAPKKYFCTMDDPLLLEIKQQKEVIKGNLVYTALIRWGLK